MDWDPKQPTESWHFWLNELCNEIHMGVRHSGMTVDIANVQKLVRENSIAGKFEGHLSGDKKWKRWERIGFIALFNGYTLGCVAVMHQRTTSLGDGNEDRDPNPTTVEYPALEKALATIKVLCRLPKEDKLADKLDYLC